MTSVAYIKGHLMSIADNTPNEEYRKKIEEEFIPYLQEVVNEAVKEIPEDTPLARKVLGYE